MKRLRDRVFAVTGAGSGIGRALAGALAHEGVHLALCDIDEPGLDETARGIRGVRVTTQRVDVADRAAVFAWAEQAAADHGAVHGVVNNAGVALAASLRSVSFEDFEWLMQIDFWGVVNGTRAFLPILERQDEGHIVNISSVFGIVAAPLNGTYNAAKFAVRGYTEALRMELALDGLPIGVTCVHPGGIKTNIARRSRMNEDDMLRTRDQVAEEFERLAATMPDRCADRIIEAIRDNAPRVLVGLDARLIDTMQRLLPTGYQRLARFMVRDMWRKKGP